METNTIFLISKLWIDSYENNYHRAQGYKNIGYVTSQKDANQIVKSKGTIKGMGWPFERGKLIPIIKINEIPLIISHDLKEI